MDNIQSNTFNIMIDNQSYNVQVLNSKYENIPVLSEARINSIDIKLKNTTTKESYHASLYNQDINFITSTGNLICDMDNFYNFLLSSFSKKNEKININCEKNDDDLIINLFFTIEFLNIQANYKIVLCKIKQTAIERIEEILLDINNEIIINKKITNNCRDELDKLKQDTYVEIKKWNYIEPINPNYYFGINNKFIMYINLDGGSNYIKLYNGHSHYNERGCSEKDCISTNCIKIRNIVFFDNNNYKVAIPPCILQKSKKIKISISVQYMFAKNDFWLKIYTDKNNVKYLRYPTCGGAKIFRNDIETFEIISSDTFIYIENYYEFNPTVSINVDINLIAYK